MIELSEQKVQALESQKAPVQVVNPKTQETFFLIRKDVYDLVCNIVSVPNRKGWDNDDDLTTKKA